MISRLLARLRSLWRGVRRRSGVEAEMDEEFRLHLELHAQRLVQDGLAPAEARRQARREFGSLERYKDEGRAACGLRYFDGLRFSWLDFKLGFRMLAKYPGLAVVGGLAMAFAIWVGALGFELVQRIVFPKLPLDEGERVVALQYWDAGTSDVQDPTSGDFAAWRRELTTIEKLGAFRALQRNLIGADGRVEPVHVAEISASAFRMARVPPLLGRTLDAEDEGLGAAPVAVLRYDVWRRHFDADPDIVGRSIRLDRTVFTVVGVMPKGFAFPRARAYVWVPLRLSVPDSRPGHGPAVRVFGRLADGVSLADAQAEFLTVASRIAADAPETTAELRPRIVRYANSIVSRALGLGLAPRALLSVNLFLILLVVLVCGNVALLMFARAATRESELVVRNALGASRGRIIGQLFAEALVLAGVAAAVGLLAADFALRWQFGLLEVTGVTGYAFWDRKGLAPPAVVYAGALTVLAAVVAGVVPALKVTRHLGVRLRQAGPGGGGFRFGGIWTGVVIVQIAAMVAFPVVGFFVRELTVDIRSVDFGFPSEEFLSVRLEIDGETASGAPIGTSRAAFLALMGVGYRELERRFEAEPGVIGVTFSDGRPLMSRDGTRPIALEGGAAPADSADGHRRVRSASVALDYLDLLKAPVLAGRAFHAGDVESDAPVVIVNESFVDHVLGGVNPIGQRVRYVQPRQLGEPGLEGEPWYEIIGLVRDIGRPAGGTDADASGIYHRIAPGGAMPTYLAVHTRGNPEAFVPRLRSIAAELDPRLRLHDMIPLDDVRRFDLWELSLLFWLVTVVSAGAMFLSLAGIYSVLSFTVSQRTREIGIRLALGGESPRVAATIARRPLAQAGLGILIGAGLTVWMSHVVNGRLTASDGAHVLAYVILMLGVCLLACVVPARRALAVEPIEALKADR